MARRSRAGEDQLELTGLGEESPSDPAATNTDGPGAAEASESLVDDPLPSEAGAERRAPFAMGRMSNRTREVHLARGEDHGPIPGPWKLRAVVRPGPGSASASGSETASEAEALAEKGTPDDSQD